MVLPASCTFCSKQVENQRIMQCRYTCIVLALACTASALCLH
nr:MAG TPA: hypothetical protein [Caudoviricetes sp.]